MIPKIIDEIIGWYGTVAILLAYALNSFNIILTNAPLYSILNLTGATGIAYISFKKKTYQPGVLNAVWALIAIIAIIKLLV